MSSPEMWWEQESGQEGKGKNSIDSSQQAPVPAPSFACINVIGSLQPYPLPKRSAVSCTAVLHRTSA
jgi:hypothetical protein